MTPYKQRLNKYIQRMSEDMQLRNFADATIDAYTYHADKFCQYFGKTADKLGPEQLEMQLVESAPKPSWRDIFEVTTYRDGTYCPTAHIDFGNLPEAHSIGGYG